MTEVYPQTNDLLRIPDDITLAQFMLKTQHHLRPVRSGTPCFIEDGTGRKISFDETKNTTYAFAKILRSTYNISDNDVVFISSPNHIAYPIIFWAVLLVGGIISCSNPHLSVAELEAQLKDVKATLVIGHSVNISTVLSAARGIGLPPSRVLLIDQTTEARRGSIPNVHDLIESGLQHNDDFQERVLGPGEGKRKIALLSWSSGTTGNPKAVAISHYALIANIIQMTAHDQAEKLDSSHGSQGFQSGDVALGVLPFYHVAGLVINLHFVFFCAMSIVIAEKYRVLTMLDSIVRHRITHLILVPPIAVDLCKHPAVEKYDLKTIKCLIIGAAPVPKEVQVLLNDLFPAARIGQAYGLTEATATLAMISGSQARGPLGSGGRLLPGVQARVVKPDGSLAGRGEEGELLVKAPSTALGYPNDQKATEKTFVDEWLRTGDQVFLSETNEVFIVGRLKELMKVKGHQVAPSELEGCLLTHPDVLDCCVVSVTDDRSGELPFAYIVLAPLAKERSRANSNAVYEIKKDIVKHIADRFVSYKQLKGGIEFIEEIPKTGSGKLLRRILRDMAQETRSSQTRCRARL